MSDDEAEMAQLRQNSRFQESAASKLSEAKKTTDADPEPQVMSKPQAH